MCPVSTMLRPIEYIPTWKFLRCSHTSNYSGTATCFLFAKNRMLNFVVIQSNYHMLIVCVGRLFIIIMINCVRLMSTTWRFLDADIQRNRRNITRTKGRTSKKKTMWVNNGKKDASSSLSIRLHFSTLPQANDRRKTDSISQDVHGFAPHSTHHIPTPCDWYTRRMPTEEESKAKIWRSNNEIDAGHMWVNQMHTQEKQLITMKRATTGSQHQRRNNCYHCTNIP